LIVVFIAALSNSGGLNASMIFLGLLGLTSLALALILVRRFIEKE
jgi:hypothetical protein